MPNVASPTNNQHKDLLLTDLSFIPRTTEVSIRTPYWTNKSFQKDQLEDVLDGMIFDGFIGFLGRCKDPLTVYLCCNLKLFQNQSLVEEEDGLQV